MCASGCGCLSRRYICILFINNLPKLPTTNVNRSNGTKWSH